MRRAPRHFDRGGVIITSGIADVLGGTWAWVWTEPPSDLGAFTGAIVRAANGEGHTSPAGFDFRTSYQSWANSTTQPLIAWTFLYASSDGVKAAQQLAAVDAVAYVIDWEDDKGAAASGYELSRCVAELRRQRPGRPVGFSSYPTRAQCEDHGVDYMSGVAVCDFVSPQMYYDYQAADYPQIIADARGRYVQLAVAPADRAGWVVDARTHLHDGSGVSFWRLGVLTPKHRLLIAQLTEEFDMDEATVQHAVRVVLGLHENMDPIPGHTRNDTWAHDLMVAQAAQGVVLTSLNKAVGDLALALTTLAQKIDALGGGAAGATADQIVTLAGQRMATPLPVVTMAPPPATATAPPPIVVGPGEA